MLKDIPIEELQAEIERREKVKRKQEKPRLLEESSIDLSMLRNACAEQINIIEDDSFNYEKYKQYIYEKAMEAFYGINVWAWINKKLK
jgi:hypothetical protein